jgi:hypothetical protein
MEEEKLKEEEEKRKKEEKIKNKFVGFFIKKEITANEKKVFFFLDFLKVEE